MSAALALEAVSLVYGRRTALDGVDLRAAPGEVLALLGPSASGKTSSSEWFLGFAAPRTGIVRLGDRVVSRDGRVVVAPVDRRLGVVSRISRSGRT